MRNILSVLFALGATFTMVGQSYEIDAFNGQTVTTCGGNFYDSGGPTGGYQNGENYTITFCPATPGAAIQIQFSFFNVQGSSQLCVFDGTSTAANAIGCTNDATLVSAIGATAANTSGCITLQYTSTSTGGGWIGAITCRTPCQPVLPFIPTAATADSVYSPTPAYLDICQGETINFIGSANYPQNNLIYVQDDATSRFDWNFGDGLGVIGNAQFATYTFPNPGGYRVKLKVTDQNGCIGEMTQNIRVSTDPSISTIITNDTICLGDTTFYQALAQPTQGSFAPPFIVADSLYLPDGIGVAYSNSVNVGIFPTGATVTNPNDINSICLLFEHSYLGDLQMEVTCPNGTTVVLKPYPGGGNTFLGEPVDIGPNGISGLGYNYCFTDINPTYGTMLNESFQHFYNYTDVLGNTYTNQPYLPSGSYTSENPLSGFVGCPLNGNWTFTISDNLGADDGFIFNWRINFAPSLYPNIEYFTPGIHAQGWQNAPGILNGAGTNSVELSPTTPGTHTFIYQVVDSFGCTYNNPFTLVVLPPGDLACIECGDIQLTVSPQADTICPGQSVSIFADVNSPIAPPTPSCDNYEVRNVAFDRLPVPTSATILNMTDNMLSPASLGFTFDFFCTPQTDAFISSNGFITFDQFGGNGCCQGEPLPTFNILDIIALNWEDLNPAAGGQVAYFVTGAAPNRIFVVDYDNVPYTGSVNTISGQIKLFEGSNIIEIHSDAIVPDDATQTQGIQGGGFFNQFAFTPAGRNAAAFSASQDAYRFTPVTNPFGNSTYAWSPVTGLNNPNSPSPIASPSANTDYVVTATWRDCVWNDTVHVEVRNVPNPTPVVTCGTATSSSVSFNWSAIPGVINYEYSINNGPWQPTLNTTAIATGLGFLENVNIRVRATTALCGVSSATSLTCQSLDIQCGDILLDFSPLRDTICAGQNVQLNANVYSPLAPVMPNCTDYSVLSITHAPISVPGSATTLTLTDDQLSSGAAIGFPFNFFCQDYTTAFISSNGFLTFDPGAGSGCCSGQLLPNNNPVNNVVSLSWEDLNPGVGGTIRYFTAGIAPNRIFVVDFNNISYFGGTGTVTGQMQLHENSNIVEIHSTSIDADGIQTQGIEDATGSYGFTPPGRNAASWSATNSAFRFTPVQGNMFANAVYTWTPNTNINNASIPNPVVSPTTTTVYTVNATWRNCSWTNAATITVGTAPSVVLTCGTATQNSVQFNWAALTGITSYQYSTNNGATWVTTSNTSAQISGLTIGQSVTIQVRAIDPACGAGPVTSLTCTSLSCNPIAATLSAPVQVCPGEANGILSLNVVGDGPFTYNWSDGQAANPSINLAAGSYNVTITDANNCTAVETYTVGVAPVPQLNPWIGQPGWVVDTIVDGDEVLLFAGFNEPGVNYVWTPASFFSNPNGATVNANQTNVVSETYAITVTANNGQCSASQSVTLVVTPSTVGFFNAFTPNGDGTNDTFYPKVGGNTDVVSFQIYNRWGQLVHDNPDLPWDGSHDGEAQPREVYFFHTLIKLPTDTEPKPYSGDVTLIR